MSRRRIGAGLACSLGHSPARSLAVALALAAGAAGVGCDPPEPVLPSEAAVLADESRVAAGLPPRAEAPPPEAPEETAAAEAPPPETREESAAGDSPPPPDPGAAAAAARGEAVAVSRLIEEKEGAAEGAPADPTVIQIGPAADGGYAPQTLAEAAAAAREKRRSEGQQRSTLVINNDNLAAFGAGGQVTLVTPGPTAAPPAAGAAAAPGAAPADTAADAAAADPERGPAGPRDELYWRDRTRGVRTRWADAAREVERLEDQAAQLRWDFYAEDDPWYRDERIKPEWDRVLDELRRARQDVRAYREELAEVLEEGRRAGALPGWLRDGIELEPEEPDSPVRREPGEEGIEEPTIFGEGEGERP